MANKPLTTRKARAALESQNESRKEAVVQGLEALASSEITDVLSWDDMGQVQVRASHELSPRAKQAIKKVKITQTQDGANIEVEMHDKLSALRLLAKHRGLLEPNSDETRPSMIGINVTGPKTTTYEVKDDEGSTDT
ncbi:terminase small subunit [uncultured Marinobacter sp.]|uniref:terminase small subunit n=1 Tax=uncultured Marinobacter sp. TaxID=187379 RepID=UPI0030D81E1E